MRIASHARKSEDLPTFISSRREGRQGGDMSSTRSKYGSALCAVFAFFLTTQAIGAEQGGAVTGTVSDPLGGRGASATGPLPRDREAAGAGAAAQGRPVPVAGASHARAHSLSRVSGIESTPA